jgi:hypothetical protein
MRRLGLITSLIVLASPALASAPPKGKATAGQYVDLAPMGLPIVGQGRLVNYAFVNVRLNLAASADPAKLRAKEPYFRDALVRLGHRTPLNRSDDYMKIDEARLRAALMREVSAIAGPGAIRSVVVTSQTPRHRVASPRKGA